MTSSRQYKCDARDNYITIFYFTSWIRNGYSLQDLRRTNRTAGSSSSLRRLPGPGPRGGESDCGHCADLPAHVLRACRDMVRSLFGVGLTDASVPLVVPPLSWRRERRLAAPPNTTVCPIPRFSFPRTLSAPLLTSRSSYPLARRRVMTPCPSRPRRGRIGWDRSPII